MLEERNESIAVLNDIEPELCQLLQAIECPVCRQVPKGPPIFNCENGHFTCNECRYQLECQRCPYCSSKFTTMRNYSLESILTANVFKCDHFNFGCEQKSLTLSEYEKHLEICSARDQISSRSKAVEKSTIATNTCPKCLTENPKRKLKCQDCNFNLRTPTPMFLSDEQLKLFSDMKV